MVLGFYVFQFLVHLLGQLGGLVHPLHQSGGALLGLSSLILQPLAKGSQLGQQCQYLVLHRVVKFTRY